MSWGRAGGASPDALRRNLARDRRFHEVDAVAAQDGPEPGVVRVSGARGARVHRLVERRLGLLGLRPGERHELAGGELAGAERGELADPVSVVGDAREDLRGRRLRGPRLLRPELLLEEVHPERVVDELVVVELGGDGAREPVLGGEQILPDERARDRLAERGGDLPLVVRRRLERALERLLRLLVRPEPVEHPREHLLDPRALLGRAERARVREDAQRVDEPRARLRDVAGVVLDVARQEQHLAVQRRVPRRVGRLARGLEIVERGLRLLVVPVDAGERQEDGARPLLRRRRTEERPGGLDAPLLELDEPHHRAHLRGARRELVGRVGSLRLLREREERRRGRVRPPHGVEVARRELDLHRADDDGQRPAHDARVRVGLGRLRHDGRARLREAEVLQHGGDQGGRLRLRRVEAVRLQGDPERRRAEELVVLLGVLLFLLPVARARGQRVQHLEPLGGGRLRAHGVERALQVDAPVASPLAPVPLDRVVERRASQRPERPADVGVAQEDLREDVVARLQRAHRLADLLPRRVRLLLLELHLQLHRRRDPVERRLRRLELRALGRLEEAPRHARALDRPRRGSSRAPP